MNSAPNRFSLAYICSHRCLGFASLMVSYALLSIYLRLRLRANLFGFGCFIRIKISVGEAKAKEKEWCSAYEKTKKALERPFSQK